MEQFNHFYQFVVKMQEVARKHKVFFSYFAVLFNVEESKRFRWVRKHDSDLLLQLDKQQFKSSVRLFTCTFSLQLPQCLADLLFLEVFFFIHLSLEILLRKYINQFVQLLQIKNGAVREVIWHQSWGNKRRIIRFCSGFWSRSCQFSLFLLSNILHQVFKQHLFVRSGHPHVDISVQILEVLA